MDAPRFSQKHYCEPLGYQRGAIYCIVANYNSHHTHFCRRQASRYSQPMQKRLAISGPVLPVTTQGIQCTMGYKVHCFTTLMLFFLNWTGQKMALHHTQQQHIRQFFMLHLFCTKKYQHVPKHYTSTGIIFLKP